jgi:hypothetical protein
MIQWKTLPVAVSLEPAAIPGAHRKLVAKIGRICGVPVQQPGSKAEPGLLRTDFDPRGNASEACLIFQPDNALRLLKRQQLCETLLPSPRRET